MDAMDELEPGTGRYDWEEAFRQNPDTIDDAFCHDLDCDHLGCQGEGEPDAETLRVIAAALTVQAEEFLAFEADAEESRQWQCSRAPGASARPVNL